MGHLWFEQGCQPLQYERFVNQRLSLGDPNPQAVQRATEVFHQEAAVLNAHRANQEYLVNNTLTLAVFSVASDLTYATDAQFPLDDYPPIRYWVRLFLHQNHSFVTYFKRCCLLASRCFFRYFINGVPPVPILASFLALAACWAM